MTAKQHVVCLTPAQRAELGQRLTRDATPALEQRRARILLHADAGPSGPKRTDVEVAAAVGVDPRTVARVRAVCATEGFAIAVHGHPRARQTPPKLDSAQAARLVALACMDPPPGHARWSVRLWAERVVEWAELPPVSRELIRRTFKKTNTSPGWCGGG